MFRQLIVSAALVCAAQQALAADAGKIIFAAGLASIAGQPAAEGMAVQEGQMLSTGADGFIYIKTIDNGLFILRPDTKARIAAYHVDAANPVNTRIKLELLSGVARSRSGEAVKLARQNFRFNTPVAAIGVRGTDFTVFTDSDTSRVAVISGGVVVSAFGGACRPEGGGPCEGNASRELSAAQRGQLLQVSRGKGAPQLLQSSPLSPDQVSPPRADEPIAKSGTGTATGEANLEAKKAASLSAVIGQGTPVPTPAPVIPPPPALVEPARVVDTRPERGIVWGRFQQVEEHHAQIDLTAEREKSELLAVSGNFALFRTPGKDYVLPNNGSLGFALRDSNAFVYTDYSYDSRVVTPATLANGQLRVDFGSKTFETGLDLISKGETTRLQAQGALAGDGRLYGDAANGRVGFINVQGVLSNDKGGTAAYIFDGRLDSLRTVNGATYWSR